MRFLWFSYYKTTLRTTVWCGSLSLTVQSGYFILRAILTSLDAIVLFEWFGEHP